MDNFFTSNKISSNYSRTYSKGKSFKFSVWNSKDTYNNDEFVQDFVQWDKTLWAAKKTSINIPPKEGEYWELIVKGVSDIEFRQVDNRIEYRYIDPTSEWKDLFELASVSEDQIRKMLEDLGIKYGNTYDVKLSETSTNAVQNQVVTKKFKELDNKNTKTESELINIKSSVNTALSNSKSYTDSKISETKIQIDSELNKKANQTDVNEVVDVLNENINLKVDKVSGKGLSTNDFNDNYKSKLDNLDSSLNSTLTSAKSHTNSEITKVNNKINSEISRAQASETNLSGRINDLEEDLVDALQEAKEYTDSLANGEVKNNTNKINTLNGTGEGSVIKTVKDEISNLVGTAPEKLDTLQEIAEYLEEHEDMASGLVNSLSGLEAKKADKTELNNLKTETDSALATKANTTGYYPQMSVGQADNLPDRGDVLEGFIGFRESAGAGNSIEDGTANVQELLGESLVWNQKANYHLASASSNGITAELLADGRVRIYGTATNNVTALNIAYCDSFIVGHKYLLTGPSNVDDKVYVHWYKAGIYNSLGTSIISPTSLNDGYGYVYIRVNSGAVVDWTGDILCHDLTQMFGAGYEPSTIEEFEAIKNQLVGVDFNAYNEGEILGVNIKGFKSVNDNAWDEEWEVGTFLSDGSKYSGGEYVRAIRSKNFIKVIPSQKYKFVFPYGGTLWACQYDSNKNFISRYSIIKGSNNETYTMPENVSYIKFGTHAAYGGPYANDICIRLAHSGYKTDYVAHEVSESSFDLTPYFPNGMHGINGVRDSVTKSKAVRRFGVVDLGTLNWIYDTTYGGFVGYISGTNNHNNVFKIAWKGVCVKYPYYGEYNLVEDKGLGYIYNTNVFIKDSSYADVASFKTAISGVMLYHELATPIETEIDPQLNMNYKVWDFGTEELLTDSKSAPVLARTIYGFNATDTIRGNKATNEEQDARLHTLESEVVRKGDYSPDNSVGFADDLVGRGESVPAEFSFRASGGKSIKDGAARIKRLKGNSVVWNQKIKGLSAEVNNESNPQYMGLTYTYDESSNILTINGTSTKTWQNSVLIANSVAGHTYYISARKVGGTCTSAGGQELQIQNGYGRVIAKPESSSETVGTLTGFTGVRPALGVGCGVGDVFNNYQVRVQYIDLTQMFQSGNEPTTIEEFYARKPIVEDEYAYNEGEVIHMTAEGIKSVGDNAWDEEWRLGSYDAQGNFITGVAFIVSKNPIRVLSNNTYHFSHKQDTGVFVVYWYDNAMKFISRNYVDKSASLISPNGACYMNFRMQEQYGATYKNDIMITLVHSGWKQDTDAGYQPYWEDRLIFDQRIKDEFPDGMSKWDMVYNKNGKGYIVHGTGVKKLWELNGWVRGASTLVFIATIPDMMPSLNINNGIMAEYNLCSSENGGTMIGNAEDKSYITNGGAVGGPGKLAISDTAYNDVDSFVAHLEEVQAKLYYQLAEPTIIEYDEPFNLDYRVADFGTEQAIAEQPSVPISADIIYQFNAVDMIREHELEIAELQSIIATQKTTITSNSNEIASLKTLVASLQTQIQQLQTSITAVNNKVTEITVTE